MESGRSKTKLRPLGTVNCRKARNPMITGHLGSFFYTFLTKCLISHGYRLFKCCSKCSEQCFQITLNFQTKKIDELANAFMDAQEKNLKDMIFQVPSLSLRNTYL